jgi:hypothetical protein
MRRGAEAEGALDQVEIESIGVLLEGSTEFRGNGEEGIGAHPTRMP